MEKSLHNFPLKFVQAPFFIYFLHCVASEGSIKKTKTGKSATTPPFVCAQCNFSCTQTGYLKRHMLKHSGEKPFL